MQSCDGAPYGPRRSSPPELEIFRADNGWIGGIYSLDLQGNGGRIATIEGVGDLAVDSKYLYWAKLGGDLWRADKDGGNAVEFFVGKMTVPGRSIAAKAGRLFYASSASSGLVAVDPADMHILSTYSGMTHVDAFDVGSSFVVWVDKLTRQIYRAPLVSDGASAYTNITPLGLSLGLEHVRVVTDDACVYVQNSSDINAPGPGTISRFRIDGSDLSVVATYPAAIFGFAHDQSALYFTTESQRAIIARAPISARRGTRWNVARTRHVTSLSNVTSRERVTETVTPRGRHAIPWGTDIAMVGRHEPANRPGLRPPHVLYRVCVRREQAGRGDAHRRDGEHPDVRADRPMGPLRIGIGHAAHDRPRRGIASRGIRDRARWIGRGRCAGVPE
jgi:hypothetical protein